MSLVIIFFLLFFPDARLNTSFYTFHKVGAYSISDFYFNYLFSRYNLNLVLERRPGDTGLKSFSLTIDSLLKYYNLTAGEKQYYLNGPLSTTLPLYGFVLSGEDIGLFLGKTKDQTSALPPTFRQNNFTLGLKIAKNFAYRIPVELYFVKKNDLYGDITDNNSLGANIQLRVAEKFLINSQLGANLSRLGIGGGLGLGMNYTDQRYGANAYFRKIFKNFVTPSNFPADEGAWFQLNSYTQPLTWFSFGQGITYSNPYGPTFAFNWTVNKFPFLGFGYGIDFNYKNKTIGHNFQLGLRYKRSSFNADFALSSLSKSSNFKFSQDIKNCKFWSQMQLKEGRVYQLGGILPLSPNIRPKIFLNFSIHKEQKKINKGIELSLRLFRNFALNTTYQMISHNKTNEHQISLSMSNSLLFEQMGFGFISGKVFIDLNNNGIFDKADCAVSDVEVFLDNKISVKTDKNGDYQFSFVPPGVHRLRLKLISVPAEFGSERMDRVVNTRFLSRTRVHFLLGELGLIEGIVYYDDNKNGKKDPEEEGVPNVVLGLNGYLTTTKKDGKFRFANLISGTYVLEVKMIPPETFLTITELSYIYIEPGGKFVDYQIGVIRKEYPVQKKIFEEPQIIKPKQVIPSKSKPPKTAPEK